MTQLPAANGDSSMESSLLTVRFSGRELRERGVAIYDLGITLVAVQRMIHKAYLARTDRLSKGAYPNLDERTFLQLQLGERRRESDAFGFISAVTNPATAELMQRLADMVFSGVVSYAVGDVIKRFRKSEVDTNPNATSLSETTSSDSADEEVDEFLGSIGREVVAIVNRIDAAGGVNTINIGAPILGQARPPAVLGPLERARINDLASTYYLGRSQQVKGDITALFPKLSMLEIRRPGGKKCKVVLGEDLFARVRYEKAKDLGVTFVGRPMYQFGREARTFDRFEAHNITFSDGTTASA